MRAKPITVEAAAEIAVYTETFVHHTAAVAAVAIVPRRENFDRVLGSGSLNECDGCKDSESKDNECMNNFQHDRKV